ncbi:RHS repeat-associated core domain-containing protein [Luteibacter sp. CQ10]|uniref:RHS repeat-associated core domain-containing protein n=1 Tax=Luteibacter sp. CQ10 TaxID=2805821 RepID=UPI0034A1CFB7
MSARAHGYGAYGGDDGFFGAHIAFAGEYRDADTGWYRLGERFYSPVLRRFLGPDPESPMAHGGVNRYGYCAGDPVNRIDPTGNAWWSWLASATDDVLATISAPAMSSITRASTDEATARATQGGGRLARRRASDIAPIPGQRHGFRAGHSPPKRGAGSSHGGHAPEPGILLHKGLRYVPADRLRRIDGKVSIVPRWQDYAHIEKPQSIHWVSDSEIFGFDLRELMPRIRQHAVNGEGSSDIYIYSGVHGSIDGNNWTQDVRRSGPVSFHTSDRNNAFGYELLSDHSVTVEDIAAVSRREMKRRMRRRGHHVHAYCFSMADNLVMKKLGIAVASVYEL